MTNDKQLFAYNFVLNMVIETTDTEGLANGCEHTGIIRDK